MVFALPNLSPSLLLLLQSKTCSKEKQTFQPPVLAQTPKLCYETLSVQSTTLQGSPVSSPSLHQDKLDQSQSQRDEFYVNLGLAVRTLREDLPLLFTRDINYDIYRWNLRGVPRVPWEAKGQFQGTSRYKLDRNGKIYEHKVDNLAFNFPQQLKPAASVLDLVAACPASPNPTFLWAPVDTYPSSWVAFYRAVRETLDQEGYLLSQDGLAACS
ncbi:hypothetical protein V6N13_118027 [Hibiscus sabdariffa]|uniref:Uncharacterized protein n=1 Tax=Hibiscus sabdariffa TaxID=183260 RepID=A0ABR2Q8Z2_9ROSI